MIRVEPTQEPATFDAECRKKGLDWLNGIQSGQTLTRLALLSGSKEQKKLVPRPTSYWNEFEEEIHNAFGGRCAYSTFCIDRGDIDHFIPQSQDPLQMFEWSNYRYADSWINKTRKNCPFPDPFCIQDDWFSLGYPSLLLNFTADAPPEYSAQFEIFIKIMNHPKIIRTRERWRDEYIKHLEDPTKGCTMDFLERSDPMLARAIRQHELLHGALIR